MLHNKKILVGVCGSIAAYKTAFLIRLLVKEGAEVKVVMTSSAHDFVTPVTLSTLSKNPVYTDFADKNTGSWNNHVELGLWADAMVIAPASANTIAKMANGLCDNLLSAVYLSARCPVFVAPAMDLDMYLHPSTQENLKKLKSFQNIIIDPETGELASGLQGQGRMAEPENIVALLKKKDNPIGRLSGKKVIVTAGPTYEAIDPVRFISNHSSGKMGYELANTFSDEGAEVHLISGPVHSDFALNTKVLVHKVVSAGDMHAEVNKYFPLADIVVFAAAVADYTPVEVADNKIKKDDSDFSIHLKKTKDIAGEAGKKKQGNQFIVGFALETDNELENARKKLISKNMDIIVLNSLKDEGAGFGKVTNKITIIDKDNNELKFELKSKKEVAKDIVNTIIEKMHV